MSGDQIILYEPDEMIIICGPKITLAKLDKALRENGQWIATLLPDEREHTTLGDALAHNIYHPRARFGSPLATSVLGGTFETFDGHVFKSGSRVVKSVAGYDTHRAFVGSEGKLFHAREFTLKVMPRPKQFIRFTTSLEHQSIIAAKRPLVLEEWEGQLVVEFGGESEDMTLDREGLASNALIEMEIGDEWGEMIKAISGARDSEVRSRPVDPVAKRLLEVLTTNITAD